jgi:hypothetical protein
MAVRNSTPKFFHYPVRPESVVTCIKDNLSVLSIGTFRRMSDRYVPHGNVPGTPLGGTPPRGAFPPRAYSEGRFPVMSAASTACRSLIRDPLCRHTWIPTSETKAGYGARKRCKERGLTATIIFVQVFIRGGCEYQGIVTPGSPKFA